MGRPVLAQWVLPSIDPRYRAACLATLDPQLVADRLLVVDNTVTNRGVAASWNAGIDEARRRHAGWLVIASESVRFGHRAGLDVELTLRAAGGDVQYVDGLIGWHLIAFRREVLEAVGYFDENFWPAYMEDTDYLIRLHLAGFASPRENDRPGRKQVTSWNVWHTGTEHSLREGLAPIDLVGCRRYFEAKWGGPEPHGGGWRHPFDDRRHDWKWWPTVERAAL